MKKNLFSTNRQAGDEIGAVALLTALQSAIKPGTLQQGQAKTAVSMESIGEAELSTLNMALEGFAAPIEQGLIEHFKQATETQVEAGIYGAVVASAPTDYIGRNRYSEESLTGAAGVSNNVATIPVGSVGLPTAKRNVAFESFDTTNNRNLAAYSATFNALAARQFPAGEMLYPTVVVAPNQQGYTVDMREVVAFDAVTRSATGALDTFNRKKVIKALIDASILATDQTKLIPVYRTGSVDSSANFVSGITATNVVSADGETISTAPLAIGKKFSLLALCQTTSMLAAGATDQTDSVDTARLSSVILKLVVGGTTEFYRVDVSNLPTADFNAAVQGNDQILQLNFSTNAIPLTSSTKTIGGTTNTLMASIGSQTARISISVSGKIVRDLGDTETMASTVTLKNLTDASGTAVDTTSGAGATLKTLLETITIAGYELIAYRTNSNRRNQGKLLDFQVYRFLYNTPLLPPLSMARSILNDASGDAQMLADLVSTSRIQSMGAMVTELLRARDTLQAYAATGDVSATSPQLFGAASLVVNPVYKTASLDVAAAIDSRTANDRIADLKALLINKIRDMATQLYITSGYGPALEGFYPNQGMKPEIVVVCDPELNNYLNIIGDTRLAGDMFNIRIEQVFDSRMAGKLMFSFGIPNAEGTGVATPLHFGNCAWRPELTAVLPTSRNGRQSMEIMVQPSYRFVTNLPILGEITVTNLSTVVAGKVAVNMRTVA